MKKKILSFIVCFTLIGSLLCLPSRVNAEEGNVAMIGNKEYATLQEAIDEAGENETTIVLIDDYVEEYIVIKAGQKIILDLNGCTLNTNVQDTIINSGLLIINDTKGGGVVDNTCSWSAYSDSELQGSNNYKEKGSTIRNNSGGVIILNGGTYYRSKEAGVYNGPNGNSCYTIRNLGEMTINEGVRIENSGSYSSTIENGWYSYSDNPNKEYAKLIINGGCVFTKYVGIKNDVNGDLVINGGSFESKREQRVTYNVYNHNKAVINDGVFTSVVGPNIYTWNTLNVNDPGYTGTSALSDGHGLKINGGYFTSGYNCKPIDIDDTDDLEAKDLATIVGGTFNDNNITDIWSTSKDDVSCIPSTHTKVAVGTDDNGQYVFKVVPIKKGTDESLKVGKGETKSLTTLDGIKTSNLRVYEIANKLDTQKDDYAWANNVETRTAKEIYKNESLVESDIADIKFDTTKGFQYTGKDYGKVEFVVSYTTLDNPTEYKTTTITIQVKPKVTAIPVMEETKLDDSYSQNVDDNNKVVESDLKNGVNGLLEKSQYANQLDNYVFDGWYTDESLKTKVDFSQVIDSDMVVYAHYVKPDVKVTFKGMNGVVIDEKNVKKGDDVDFIEAPKVEGYYFAGWDKAENDLKNVQQDLVVNAKYETIKVSVTFVDKDGKVIDKQIIDYGKDGQEPTIPQVDGYVFTGWSREYTNVKEDIIVKAEYKPIVVTVNLQSVVNGELYGDIVTFDVDYGMSVDEDVLIEKIIDKYPILNSCEYIDAYIDEALTNAYKVDEIKNDMTVYLAFAHQETGSIVIKIDGDIGDHEFTYVLYDEDDNVIDEGIIDKDGVIIPDLPLGEYRVEIKDENGKVMGKGKLTNNGEGSLSEDNDVLEFTFSVLGDEIDNNDTQPNISHQENDNVNNSPTNNVDSSVDKDTQQSSQVKTDDYSHILLYGTIMTLTGAFVAYLVKKRRVE